MTPLHISIQTYRWYRF